MTRYETYLNSDAWKQKRIARLEFDGYRCRLCDAQGELEVHHRPSSYSLIPYESVENDLTTICRACHDLITNRIRTERYAQSGVPALLETGRLNSNVRNSRQGRCRHSLQTSHRGNRLMSWKPLRLRFVGCRPLIMHNGRLCDPMDEFTKAIQKTTKKRHKTDADHEQIAMLEFLGSLWVAGNPLCPVVPSESIHACLIEGAKKVKSGPAAKAGLLCDQHAVLEYDGPRDPHELWKETRFRLRTRCKVKQSRVVRTRPIFWHWTATVAVEYEDSLLDADQVIEFASRAGFEVGIGDWRPRYGRFHVEEICRES
jgi:hypothetical protein